MVNLTLTDLLRGPSCLESGPVVSLQKPTLLALHAAAQADPSFETQLVEAGWAAPQAAGMLRAARHAQESQDHITRLNCEVAVMDEMRVKKMYWFQH